MAKTTPTDKFRTKKSKKTISKKADQSNELVYVMVGSKILYLSLVAGVIPVEVQGDGGLVERVCVSAENPDQVSVPSSCVALELAAADWERSKKHGLIAVHDVRHFIFGDEEKRDHLKSNMSSNLGFPEFPPPMLTARGGGDEHGEDSAEGITELGDAKEFVNAEFADTAAVALVLFEGLKRSSGGIASNLLNLSGGVGVTLDWEAIGKILAALSDITVRDATHVLKWAARQSASTAPPTDRLKELVELLEESDLGRSGEGRERLVKFQKQVQHTMDGELMADSKLLEDGGTLILRSLAALFRTAGMGFYTVNDFLVSESRGGQVGPRVRVVSTALAAATTGGFKSLVKPFKTEKDLYAIGSCMSAGQFDRVQLRRSAGPQGFEILLDGEVLDYFRDEERSQEISGDLSSSDLVDLLKLRTKRAGFSFSEYGEDMLQAAAATDEDFRNRRYMINGNVVVEFDPGDDMRFHLRIDFKVNKGRKKKFPVEFYEKVGRERKGGELVFNFPTVSLYRDHFGHDLNEDELKGHVKSLITGIRLVEDVWNQVSPDASIGKAKESKKSGKSKAKKKEGEATAEDDQPLLPT